MHNAAQSRSLLPVCTAFCIPPARPVWKPVMIQKYTCMLDLKEDV